MDYEVHKALLSRRSFNQEISGLLLHILSVFCIQLLFSALKLNIGMFHHKFDYFFQNFSILSDCLYRNHATFFVNIGTALPAERLLFFPMTAARMASFAAKIDITSKIQVGRRK